MPALDVLYILASVPEINRRNIMITMGLGALGAAMSTPGTFWAHPSPPAAPADAAPGNYIFRDEFDGPAGQGPDLAKWTPQTWQDDVYPPVDGIHPAPETSTSTGSPTWCCRRAEKTVNISRASCAVTGGARSTPPGKRGSNSTVCTLASGPPSGPSTEDTQPDGEVDLFSGTATANGPRVPRSTRHPMGKPGKGNQFPGWWTTLGPHLAHALG